MQLLPKFHGARGIKHCWGNSSSLTLICFLQQRNPVLFYCSFQFAGHVVKLTAVDSLEASVISRFPFKPRRAGTRIKTSFTSENTFQCCRERQGEHNSPLLHLNMMDSSSMWGQRVLRDLHLPRDWFRAVTWYNSLSLTCSVSRALLDAVLGKAAALLTPHYSKKDKSAPELLAPSGKTGYEKSLWSAILTSYWKCEWSFSWNKKQTGT